MRKPTHDRSSLPHREGLQSENSGRTIFIVRALIDRVVSEIMEESVVLID